MVQRIPNATGNPPATPASPSRGPGSASSGATEGDRRPRLELARARAKALVKQRLLVWRARVATRLSALRGPPLTRDLRVFCLFVGHGRSGSTLIGALLDAHPDIVMSNELHVLERLEPGLSAEELAHMIVREARASARRGSPGGGGYTYAVPGQWQGRARTLRVLGDRKAGATSLLAARSPERLDALRRTIPWPVRFVHVVRNPFDTISTTFHKTHRRPGEAAESHLRREIGYFFERCEGTRRVKERFGAESVLEVVHERFLADPRAGLTALTAFLGVEALPDYVEACAGIVKAEPRQSRTTVDWRPESIDLVLQGTTRFPWLSGYDFTSARAAAREFTPTRAAAREAGR